MVIINGTPVMQFVAIEREDGGDNTDRASALPGGMGQTSLS